VYALGLGGKPLIIAEIGAGLPRRARPLREA
jgi:hypothetical protein